MKIAKFGGSSVATPERIQSIIQILKEADELPRAVIFSAFGGATDVLLKLIKLASEQSELYPAKFKEFEERHIQAAEALIAPENIETGISEVKSLLSKLGEYFHGISLTKGVTARTTDEILSFGERLSNYIIHHAMNAGGINSEFLDARKLIVTNFHFGEALVDRDESYKRITEYFSEHSPMQCVTGFIGATRQGDTTTLGRGGSDYSAALFAEALGADTLEIWTDVDGVMTADPRVVPSAEIIPELSYSEAMELSHFGAKVLYPPSIQPARRKQIPLIVRNTFNPSCEGTTVVQEKSDKSHTITALSSNTNISLLTLKGSGIVGVPGSSKRLFGALAQEKINIILISQASSELSICFAVSSDQADQAKEIVDQEFELEIVRGRIDPVVVESDRAIIAVVGENMKETPGVAGSIFSALSRSGISVIAIAQGSSEENISFVVKKDDAAPAMQTIHHSAFEGFQKVSVVLLGPGQVGKAFIQQLADGRDRIRNSLGYEMDLIGIVTSKKALIKEKGIQFENWKETFEENATSYSSIDEISDHIIALHAPNTVLVDCTAADGLAPLYRTMLDKSIPVVGANKKVQSESQATFDDLTELSEKRRTYWLYESSAGAALPVISSIKALLASGDEVTRIEAILSGSISYLFNRLQEGTPFSEIIKEASELGYLEPDPRDDLNGTDFARKLLILSRLIGSKLELSDIELEPVVPKELLDVSSTEEFLNQLPSLDECFKEKTATASEQNKRLRYIGIIENGKAKLQLEAIDSNSPFYGLNGTDNLISIQSRRYSPQPLVIQGSGAGPDITASGIFTDLIRALRPSKGTL